jgi:voltage-gated potassium channel
MTRTKLIHKWPGIKFTQAFIKSFFQLLGLTSPVWGTILVVIAGLALAFAIVEKIKIFDALYYACISAMTIGYGDITPHTRMGKILSVLIGLFGIVATGIIVADALQAVNITYEEEHKKIEHGRQDDTDKSDKDNKKKKNDLLVKKSR